MRFSIALCLAFSLVIPSPPANAQEPKTNRRVLKVALYPYVPGKDGMYWKAEREFESANPDIDVQYVETGVNYYGGEIADALANKNADVAEIDTVLLEDLADDGLISELPASCIQSNTYFPHAVEAASVDGKIFGVPHWVCGNFLFFRKDDPEASRFRAIDSLDDLEQILGRPLSTNECLMMDLRGRSTLGEKYLDALLDKHQSVEGALKALQCPQPDEEILRNLDRLFALCPGGLCDSDKHHDFGEFYARQFAERECRALIGYSERMYFVVDHFLHGVKDGEPSVGKIGWPESEGYKAVGDLDVDVVPAAFSDQGQKMLSWVDVLALRSNLDDQTRKDALTFIEFFNSESFLCQILVPEFGIAPRYLLPARKSVYENNDVRRAAPLYGRFLEIMNESTAVSEDDLNAKLRAIGKSIEKRGFHPVLAK